jgi:ABC-type multidrug transport system ATPase subunit
VLKELCLSLIAPSAATLLLREITAAETLGRAFSIAQTSSAGTPMYAYLIMLGLDVAIYFAVAVYIAEFVADKASCRVLDRTPTRNVSVRTLSVSNISKQYGENIVLARIKCSFEVGTVSAIVGSNGAGKSTLLRIIAGFDSDFGGAVNLLDPQGPAGGLGASSEPRRCIGYCPQGDALFDLLSPEEHVELFLSLLLRPGSEHGQNKEPGGPSKSGEDYLFFERLGLHAVQGKQAGALSGGMRRRLSIAIASLGDPILLVLDEPTTGCDNITKEMIRKWILHMRKTSIVVFSTHLAEDVSVASDHVFLINDRFMCYDDLTSNILMGKLSKRIASPSTEAPLSDHPWLSMEFMTNEKKIMDYLFVCAQRDPAAADYFGTMGLMFGSLGSVSSSATTTAATANPKHIHSIVIPSSMVGFIWGFIRDLETQRVTNWALSSPRVFKTIGRVLENASCACTDMQECKIDRLGPLSDCCAGFKPFGVQSDQFFKILSIRRAELKSRGMQICGTTILTPLIIAFAIASACIQIDFPKLELSKGSIAMRQYGEVLIGDDFSNKPTVNKANLLRNKERLQAIFGGSAKSAEASNSDELLSMLSKSYFTHDRNRFAAVVLEDRLPGFFETVLTIPSSSLNASSLLSVYTQIVAYHREVCGSSSLPQSIQKELLFCDGDNVQYRVWMDGDGVSSNSSISISWLKSVQSNVTLLTNTSTTHALPIFLHDLMPVTYGSQRMSQTSYRLFYQPLRSVNSIDPLNLQRGYTGALILIIYMLLVTSTSGRIISYMKKTGAKHQLHLSGISLVPYWASNLLIDSLLIFVSFMAMLGSVKLCGPPVDDYFFTIPPLGGYFVVILLLAYSPAAVAATYATHVAIASDELKSQVMSVMATVVSSVCFQLFLRADKDNSFHWMEMMLFFLSPSFNFTSVLFEMFSCYGRSMMEHIASSEGIQSSSRFEAYFAARVLMLILQTGIYFATTIFIERDWLYLVTAVKTKYRAGISYVNKQAPIQWRESGDLEQMSLLRGERSARRKDYESTVATTPTTAAGIITHHPFLHTQIIAASNMTVSHDAYSSAPALSSVSLRLMQGERVALIGLNGGGKTTLFRVLSGATDTIPTSGFVEVFGVDPVSEKWSLFGLKSLGYVPQSDGLMEFLTVSETMTLFTNILKQNRPDSDTHEPASNEPVDIQNSRSHGLEMISNRYNDFAVAALSGGNKKKLLMSIATVNSPALLLLDEPTSGIDPDAAHKILDLILRMEANENNGILFASHKIDECLNLCDRIVILAEGSVVYDRTIAEFGARCFLYYTAEIFISKLALESGSTDQLIAQLEGLVCERIGVEKSANCSSIFTRIVSYDDSRLTIMCSKKAVHFSVFWSVLEELRLSGYVGHYGFREPGIEDVLSIHLENPSINIDE